MLLNNLILVNTELCETADEKYNTYFSISEVMSSTAICSNPSRDPVFWLGVHQINDQWVNIYTNQITTLPWAYGYPIRMTDTVLIDGGWHNSRVFVLENSSFYRKFQFFTENSSFLQKIRVFAKNSSFYRKFELLQKVRAFTENSSFYRKFEFLQKIRVENTGEFSTRIF